MIPGLLGLAGATGVGVALAPALQVVTIPLGVLGGAFIVRAWWLQLRHGIGGLWPRRSLALLSASTMVAATLWSLRFLGLLAPQ